MLDFIAAADIVELRVAWGKPCSLSSLESEIRATGGQWGSNAFENATCIFEELQRRSKLVGDSYPFTLSSQSISKKKFVKSHVVYLFCLHISVIPSKFIGHFERAYTFETLSSSVLCGYFGGSCLNVGEKFRDFGYQSYEESLTAVSDLIIELGSVNSVNAGKPGDYGYDLVLVKPFSDNGWPRLIVLGDCATGRTDWRLKGKATDTKNWFENYFDRDPHGCYIAAFLVPFIFDESDRKRKTYRDNIIFDRFRIVEYGDPSTAMLKWIKSLSNDVLDVELCQ